MADAVLVQTAIAVTAAIDAAPAGTFDLKFTPERSYADWQEKLEEIGKLQVDVVPVSPLPTELETRGSIEYSPSVDVVVRKRFAEAEQKESDGRIRLAEIDSLVKLVEQLSEFLTGEHLATYEDAAWESTTILASYKPSYLRDHRQFTGIIRIAFTTSNDLT